MTEKKIKKSRNYIFTINNYSKKELKKIKKISDKLEQHNYICFGLEIAPTTKTKHIQGYIQLKDNQQYTFIHNYFNLQRDGKKLKFHLQPANGTLEQNQKYTKKEKKWFEFGVPKRAGTRNDLNLIKEKISENPKKLDEIIRESVTSFQGLKFAENLVKYYLEERDPDNPPKVFWIYGKAGIGKTKLIHDTFNDVCYVSDLKWPGTSYNQNQVIVFDDFREQEMNFNIVLRITDRYPFSLAKKGGSVKLNSEYIIFTAPKDIDNSFITSENLSQLHRRVIEIDLENYPEVNLKDYKPKKEDIDF